MKRSLSIAFAAFLVLVLTATVLAVLLAPPNQDTLAGKVQVLPNGQVRISGGLSGDQWKELQSRMYPPKNYTYYAPVVSAYPTMAWKGTVKDIVRGGASPGGYDSVQSLGRGLQALWERWFGQAPDWGGMARSAVGWLLGLFTLDARAAGCTGTGNCYWVGGTGNFSDIAHWATASGGAVTGGTPAATDIVHFDASSGSGTATQDIAPFTSGAVDIVGPMTVFASGNTWNVGGSFNQHGGSFSPDTSTLVFTASGTLTLTAIAAQGNPPTTHNVTVNDTVTLTLGQDVSTGGTLTLSNATSGGIAGAHAFYLNGSTSTLLSLGVGANTTWCGAGITLVFVSGSASFDIPGGTYGCAALDIEENFNGTATGTLLGDLTTTTASFVVLPFSSVHTVVVNASTHNITVGGSVQIGGGGLGDLSNAAGLTFTTGTFTSSKAGTFTLQSKPSYIQWGSSNSHHIGMWNDYSTSASYSRGTGTVQVDTSVDRGVTFSPFAGGEFNNLTIQSTDAVSHIYTQQGDLVVANALTIQSSTDTTTLNLSSTTYNVTATTMTIGSGGNINAGGGTITVNGNLNTSGGSVFPQTATWVIGATANVTTANLSGGENFYNLTVNAGVTATLVSSVGVGNVVTANGALRIGSAVATTLFILDNAGLTDPIVIGGGGSITTARPIAELATLYFFTQAGTRINIPSSVYTNLRIAFSPINPVAGFGVEYRLLGDVTASSMVWVSRAGRPYFVNSQTFNVTLNMPVVSGPSLSDTPVDVGVRVGIQAASGTWTVGTVTLNTAGDVNFYIKFGASNWFVSGAYDNTATTDAADWSAGSGTVTFNAATGALLAFGGGGLGSTPEFHNVTVDPNVAANPGFVMGGPLVISGTFFLQNSAFGGNLVSFDVSASNYQLTADTVHLSDVGNNAIFQARQGTIKTRNWTSISANYLPTCFAAPFPGCVSAATVELYGTGTIDPKGGGGDFWNMVIDAGAVTTFVGKFPNTDVSFGIDVANQATVNGTLIADHASPQWPLVTFTVHAWTTATPIVIGAGGDASDSGFFIVGYTGNLPAISLAGGAYSAISLQIPAATTVNQAGDISTNHANCIVSATQCEFIMATYAPFPAPFFRYNTNNFALNVGGEMILGDLNNDGVNFYAGSSVISVYGFAPIENATVYLQTATLNLYPSMNYHPTAWIQERQAVVYAGSATINIHGVLRLWPFGNPGDNTALYAQSATFNLLAEDAFSGPCTPLYGCPGDVRVDEAGYYIDFGTSTWNIAGGWRSTSASASWNAGTATLNFNGMGTILPTPGAITLPEFPNINFANGSTYTATSMTFISMATGATALFTMNAFVVFGISMGASAGYILLDQWLAFDRGTSIKWHFAPSVAVTTITIVVSSTTAGGYTLYRDGVSVQQAVMTPGTASFALAGGWSPHTMEVRAQSSSAPASVTPAPSGFSFACDQGAIDWLNPIAANGTVTVTFVDGSGLAATQYLWNFDDGTPAVVMTGNTVTHTFKTGRVYAVQVDVVYASGAATYIFGIDARGANCSLQVFVRTMVVPLYVVGTVFAVAGAVALLAQRRSKNQRGRLFKALVALAVAAFIVPLIIYVYAYLAGIPLGG